MTLDEVEMKLKTINEKYEKRIQRVEAIMLRVRNNKQKEEKEVIETFKEGGNG